MVHDTFSSLIWLQLTRVLRQRGFVMLDIRCVRTMRTLFHLSCSTHEKECFSQDVLSALTEVEIYL